MVYKTLESFPKGKTCQLCLTAKIDPEALGNICQTADVIVHYFCLLLASKIQQKGSDKQGLLGFFSRDIKKEIRRGSLITCNYCQKKGATVVCSGENCHLNFHVPCAQENMSLHQYFCEFKSYCEKHKPRQKFPVSIKRKRDLECVLCCSHITFNFSLYTDEPLWPTCCKPQALLHKKCLQHFATNAGYYFKCPFCSNKTEFHAGMKKFGIFIPEQEASWETEPNAYRELLQRDVDCSARICRCPRGRDYSVRNSKWFMEICVLCGASGQHRGCMTKTVMTGTYECTICSQVNSRYSAALGSRDGEVVAESSPIVNRGVETMRQHVQENIYKNTSMECDEVVVISDSDSEEINVEDVDEVPSTIKNLRKRQSHPSQGRRQLRKRRRLAEGVAETSSEICVDLEEECHSSTPNATDNSSPNATDNSSPNATDNSSPSTVIINQHIDNENIGNINECLSLSVNISGESDPPVLDIQSTNAEGPSALLIAKVCTLSDCNLIDISELENFDTLNSSQTQEKPEEICYIDLSLSDNENDPVFVISDTDNESSASSLLDSESSLLDLSEIPESERSLLLDHFSRDDDASGAPQKTRRKRKKKKVFTHTKKRKYVYPPPVAKGKSNKKSNESCNDKFKDKLLGTQKASTSFKNDPIISETGNVKSNNSISFGKVDVSKQKPIDPLETECSSAVNNELIAEKTVSFDNIKSLQSNIVTSSSGNVINKTNPILPDTTGISENNLGSSSIFNNNDNSIQNKIINELNNLGTSKGQNASEMSVESTVMKYKIKKKSNKIVQKRGKSSCIKTTSISKEPVLTKSKKDEKRDGKLKILCSLALKEPVVEAIHSLLKRNEAKNLVSENNKPGTDSLTDGKLDLSCSNQLPYTDIESESHRQSMACDRPFIPELTHKETVTISNQLGKKVELEKTVLNNQLSKPIPLEENEKLDIPLPISPKDVNYGSSDLISHGDKEEPKSSSESQENQLVSLSPLFEENKICLSLPPIQYQSNVHKILSKHREEYLMPCSSKLHILQEEDKTKRGKNFDIPRACQEGKLKFELTSSKQQGKVKSYSEQSDLTNSLEDQMGSLLIVQKSLEDKSESKILASNCEENVKSILYSLKSDNQILDSQSSKPIPLDDMVVNSLSSKPVPREDVAGSQFNNDKMESSLYALPEVLKLQSFSSSGTERELSNPKFELDYVQPQLTIPNPHEEQVEKSSGSDNNHDMMVKEFSSSSKLEKSSSNLLDVELSKTVQIKPCNIKYDQSVELIDTKSLNCTEDVIDSSDINLGKNSKNDPVISKKETAEKEKTPYTFSPTEMNEEIVNDKTADLIPDKSKKTTPDWYASCNSSCSTCENSSLLIMKHGLSANDSFFGCFICKNELGSSNAPNTFKHNICSSCKNKYSFSHNNPFDYDTRFCEVSYNALPIKSEDINYSFNDHFPVILGEKCCHHKQTLKDHNLESRVKTLVRNLPDIVLSSENKYSHKKDQSEKSEISNFSPVCPNDDGFSNINNRIVSPVVEEEFTSLSLVNNFPVNSAGKSIEKFSNNHAYNFLDNDIKLQISNELSEIDMSHHDRISDGIILSSKEQTPSGLLNIKREIPYSNLSSKDKSNVGESLLMNNNNVNQDTIAVNDSDIPNSYSTELYDGEVSSKDEEKFIPIKNEDSITRNELDFHESFKMDLPNNKISSEDESNKDKLILIKNEDSITRNELDFHESFNKDMCDNKISSKDESNEGNLNLGKSGGSITRNELDFRESFNMDLPDNKISSKGESNEEKLLLIKNRYLNKNTIGCNVSDFSKFSAVTPHVEKTKHRNKKQEFINNLSGILKVKISHKKIKSDGENPPLMSSVETLSLLNAQLFRKQIMRKYFSFNEKKLVVYTDYCGFRYARLFMENAPQRIDTSVIFESAGNITSYLKNLLSCHRSLNSVIPQVVLIISGNLLPPDDAVFSVLKLVSSLKNVKLIITTLPNTNKSSVLNYNKKLISYSFRFGYHIWDISKIKFIRDHARSDL